MRKSRGLEVKEIEFVLVLPPHTYPGGGGHRLGEEEMYWQQGQGQNAKDD